MLSVFVKKLASNDAKVRDRALESLQKFLGAKALAKLPLLELAKLWRGLYFSMWYCDKPIPQQQLAEDLGRLYLEVVYRDSVIPFYRAFWDIIIKQWPEMDKWRLDKYLMLIRRVVRHTLIFLQKQKWNEALVEAYVECLQETVLLGLNKVAMALPYHVIDLYVDELERVLFNLDGEQEEIDDNELPIDEKRQLVAEVPMDDLLAPFKRLLTEAKLNTLRQRSGEVLADERLVEWGVIQLAEEEEGSDDEWNGFA